jgi:Lon protease-like protein
MGQTLIPLFPLQLVLFPRTPLPLHVFEERYKEMIGDVMEGNSEFGVVLASDKGICNSGCTAVVEKVLERYEDGRLDLLTLGRRRFQIESLDDEKSYLRGAVEFFDDEDFEPIPPELRKRAIEGYEALRVVGDPDGPEVRAEMGDLQLSFQLAQIVPDLNFRQMLLSARSEAERLRRLAEFLPGYTLKQKQVRHVKTVAPTNGHSKWPPNA